MTPTFLRQFVSAIYCPPLGKVWMSSVCLSPSAKPGNKAECKTYGRWVKMQVEFEAVCGPKFVTFCDDVEDPMYATRPNKPIIANSFIFCVRYLLTRPCCHKSLPNYPLPNGVG